MVFSDKIGKQQEILYFEHVKNYFKIDDLIMSNERFNKFDYISSEYLIELKTRFNYYNTFPTTIIPLFKINYGLSLNKKMIFLFNFKDGLYYINYDKNIFDTFEIKKNYCSRKDRGFNEINDYVFIPIENLIKINV